MSCREFARQLAGASPQFEAHQTALLIIGPGTRDNAQKLAHAIDIDGSHVLHDGIGDIYDAFMLNRVIFSLIQQSAAFAIDKAGIIRFAQVVTITPKWRTGGALTRLLSLLDELDSAAELSVYRN